MKPDQNWSFASTEVYLLNDDFILRDWEQIANIYIAEWTVF